MIKKLKYISLGLTIIFCIISCRHHRWTRISGKHKITDSFTRYPTYSTSYKKIGRETVVDTVDNYIVSKSRYKVSIGCFHHKMIRQKIIYYNKDHKRIKKFVLRRGKGKTVEYFNNYRKVIVKFGETDSLKTNTDSSETK